MSSQSGTATGVAMRRSGSGGPLGGCVWLNWAGWLATWIMRWSAKRSPVPAAHANGPKIREQLANMTNDTIRPRCRLQIRPLTNMRMCAPDPFSRRLWPARMLNAPATRIFPSACSTIRCTLPVTPGLKPASSVPSAFRRAKPLRDCPPIMVNEPPARTFPSDCAATQYTSACKGSAPGLKSSGDGDCAKADSPAPKLNSAATCRQAGSRIPLCGLMIG
jgi:hypothetical protein